jgi:hypothetical protein
MGIFQFCKKGGFMTNAWKVIWYENGRKLKKSGFPGDSPKASGVIDFAKGVIARGIPVANVHVVSMKKGFAPTPQMRVRQEPGTSWCPYCLKWREFRIFAVKIGGEMISPADFRCPICTISVNDYYVKKYNPMLYARATQPVVRVPKPRGSNGQLLGGRRS